MRIFEPLKFHTEKEWTGTIQKSEFGFFVPCVNSGIYEPVTLIVQAFTVEKRAMLFSLKTVKTFSEITLNSEQFDELFAEMKKIKTLRDSLKPSLTL